mmetsp:Transcript_28711/g.34976  ORF Transcript_28711/g.34976 Transcript_28711/m.34976 type:complete len:311 (+) Transcript_28711:74-1006(+)|eukprot:CAMPEP_0172514086 /NCGR_PEP_ID=MMETSP1066-20121228/257387_1 /TAXON_ID=671091 /ORGANISM="Coscinodiscus wailesii, Strain CCMP2513" /LENGTH=310 /DNA_ID=CAMNT_0013294613 /DNA_START=74 /DNA_END=1006 /DNA_ORIENTATION=+
MDTLAGGDATSTLYLLVGAIITVALAAAIHFTLNKKPKSTPGPVALKASEFQPFKVSKKEYISHDTLRITFDLQTPTTRLGLPVGHHITFRFENKEGKGVQRSYTPVTGDEVLGTVTFVIKVYKPCEKFPEGGKMSQHVDSLNVGDTLMMKGPKGHLKYLGQGRFTVKELRKPAAERKGTKFGLIAGGTGITPMLQLANAIFRDDKDKTTTLSLLYANQTENDILCREEIEALAKANPDRFSVWYTLDRPPESGWKYSTGFINKEMLEEHMPKASDSTHILMCGPPPMLKFACLPNLDAMNIKEENRFAY